MNKVSLSILLSLFPILAMADSSLSFTPPVGDYSVIFLGNIFGIVDGLLAGTGSQIMGNMFGVFNAAVLALGGIVIMYTLLVSTMNTAHEGQMLGQKWSSIYIPIRSTGGLALLIPKASGYCLMQIFVMWIVLQGVGAADKIWNAALGYLNRGGAIVQAQMNPTTGLMNAFSSGVAKGAEIILEGQVCMLALQNQLENQLQTYQTQKQAGTGPCTGNVSLQMQQFCDSTVPDFLNSVNVTSVQQNNPTAPNYTVMMPNLTNATYSYLNGICGTLKWNNFAPAASEKISLDEVQQNIPTLTQSDMDTTTQSRAIAIQQMYLTLSTVAQTIVNNDPDLANPNASSVPNPGANFSSVAIQQFGVPHTPLGPVCENSRTEKCIIWGSSSGYTGPNLFNGTEFQEAIAAYNGTMLSTLNLVREAKNVQSAKNSREFIEAAETQGWMMAGSYFFNLANINAIATSGGADLTDTDTGLDQSTMEPLAIVNQAFNGAGRDVQCGGNYATLCEWFNQDPSQVNIIPPLIQGVSDGISNMILPLPDIGPGKVQTVVDRANSSTVRGYLTNASILQIPGQPGLAPLTFANMMHINPDVGPLQLQQASFDCGGIHIIFFTVCIGEILGNLLYNDIFLNIYNTFLSIFGSLIQQIVMDFLEIPLEGMAVIFKQGVKIISAPGVNPIVALANMGTYYINFTANMWILMITMSITAALIPIFGIFIFALMALALPVVMAWLGVMVSIGFITAYYVPMLPYMLFTFGSIAWLMAVIEAMVAAPIVALGITHPEGHDAFGKGEASIMILLNVFLRPSMMIIGYIASISLSFVGVWILNAGFDNAIGFMQGSAIFNTENMGSRTPLISMGDKVAITTPSVGVISGGYSGWAGIMAYFFSIVVYTMMYVTIVQKSFGLIATLPDKVLRWIGGSPESYGQDTQQWGEEVKGKVGEAGKESQAGMAQVNKQLSGHAGQAGSAMQKKASGNEGSEISGSSQSQAT